MILAGIDEAGLGPNLGPLVTAVTAFRTPDDWDHAAPWRHLAAAVAEKPGRDETRVAVADSKLVHAGGGVAALETAVAAFFACLAAPEEAVVPFARRSRHAVADEEGWPWSAGEIEPPASANDAADNLDACLKGAGVSLAAMRTALLHPVDMNRLIDSGLNKNEILLGETGAHIADLVERFPDEKLWVMVDKQGGRNDYLPFLSRLFPGRWLDTVTSGANESTYRMRSGHGAGAALSFMPKADRRSFATALASMAAKYVRERVMRDFNAWFRARVPGLAPTAGYPVDAKRWLREAEPFLLKDGLAMQTLWRKK